VTLGSAIGTTGLLMAGSDGTNARAIKTTSDGTLLTQLTGSTVTDEIITNQNEIYSSISILIKHNEPRDIYGASWDKGSIPTLTRTDAADGKIANAGIGLASATNDFDNLPIWGEFEEVVDDYGNYFIRIPKFYIRKLDGPNFKSWQVSKYRHPGFYLPWVFWDFANKRELPYYDHGKYKASLSADNKLESKPDRYPLVNKNIVDFRTYARNNNAGGLLGYQQLDIHAVDVLRTLMFIEFATLNIQTIMQGYTTGQYNAAHTATVAEDNTNRIIVANATADSYRVGQAISVGTTLGGNQIFYGRTITSIDVYDANNKAISFDGTPVNIAVGNILYNTGWKNGFSRNIAASSGSLTANDGKYPCVYRGIESPFGDTWQFVDGVNINEFQAWVTENANDYVSNVFANPYKILGYINCNASGYVSAMGFDPNYPFAEFPTAVAGSSSTYYSDYYYQNAGQRIALVGSGWIGGSSAGPSFWTLYHASSGAVVDFGGRLLKKAL